MVHVVSFSGGRTSAKLVYLMEQRRKLEGWDVYYVYMDTGAEHPETYSFIRNVVAHWGIPLICLRVKYDPVLGNGNSYEIVKVEDIGPDLKPWEGMLKKYGTPSVVSPYCTSRMKTEPHDKFCDEVFGRGNYTTWLGIRADEPKRLKEKEGVRYLAEICSDEKQDILEWWTQQPFNLNLDEHLGNCVFCIKKGSNKLALACKDEPALSKEFIRIVESSEDVRTQGRKHNHTKMYRGTKHLSEIIEDYKEIPRESIFNNLRRSKRFESGSCSESCEVFNLD